MTERKPGMIGEVGNSGRPIRLAGLEVCGVSAEAAQCGEQVRIYTRLAISSDDPAFHVMAESLGQMITHHAGLAGKAVALDRVATLVLVIKADDSAELWLDSAATCLDVVARRAIAAGSAVFERDIADIVGMRFPLLEFAPDDRLVVLFRKNFGFGLYFDFNPDKDLQLATAWSELGRLYRLLAYRHLYRTLANDAAFTRLPASNAA